MERERFVFGPFQLDTGRHTLLEHGAPVPIGNRALALLRALVEARGDVVSKADLMQAAWPDVSVEESNLTVQISALRRRLGRWSDGKDWIATFPRLGYRFVGPLAVEACEAQVNGVRPSAVGLSQAREHRGINITAYDFFVRGRSLCLQSPSGNNLARTYLIKAIALEPTFAPAHAFLAVAYSGAATYYGETVEENRALGLACARTAVSLDPDNAVARWALGYVRLYRGELDEAQAEWEAALRIEPDHADVLAKMADLKVQEGRPEAAVASVEKAVALNAYPPGGYYWDLGFAYYAAGRYADAVEVLRKEEVGRLPAKRILAASLAQLDLLDEARVEARRFLEINPGFQVSRWAATQSFKQKEDRQHFVDGYIRAGLPL